MNAEAILRIDSSQDLENLRRELHSIVARIDARLDSARYIANASEIAELTKLFYIERFRRRRFLPEELLGEPAWDMILDLFYAHLIGKRVSVTSACLASGVPPTTGLRWLGQLEQRKMVYRESDPDDNRRTFVCLTADTVSDMVKYMRTSVFYNDGSE